MAATDQTYRSQRHLDVWFAISSLLMLFSTVWMFWQDYFVPWKPEQRVYRDVKSQVALHKLLDETSDTFDTDHAKAVKDVDDEREALKKGKQEEIDELKSEIRAIQPQKEKADAKYQGIKSKLESVTSFYNQAVDNGKQELAVDYKKEMTERASQLQVAKAEQDEVTFKLREKQNAVLLKEKPLNDALAHLNKLNSKLDTLARTAIKEQWYMGDRFRALPIIDAFASPYKIHQFVIDDIPIDYNFKYVTRFDRCMTCHQGIADPDYSRDRLLSLRGEIDSKTAARLDKVKKVLEQRRTALSGLPDELKKVPDPALLNLNQLSESWLTNARVSEFTSHPRLDLFVGAKSKHPAEKFGCSSCHQGQGSATSFTLASHSPNNSTEQERWAKEHHWHPEHMWDFPMLPHRFVESSCLKCHHQVTDLIDSDNRNNAPKLIRGYNLIKENGCFGCHEIGGRKAGRSVGPDLRLEPYPPRDDRTAAEVAKLDADPDEAPGHMRKVGPSLYRLSEKTNKEWTARWIKAPRAFRPETKMPHFYGVSNNNKEALHGTGQEAFPDAEAFAITHYLFNHSDKYLKDVAAAHAGNNPAIRSDLQNKLQALERKAQWTEAEKKDHHQLKAELDEMNGKNLLLKAHAPLNLDATLPKADIERGRFLFTMKGCLACHSHRGVENEMGKSGTDSFFPKIITEAQFGPDLSQLAAKLGSEGKADGKKTRATNWLVQWIKDPHVHSPRSRMPQTHMSDQEAADIAAWLMAQNPEPYFGPGWKDVAVARPSFDALKKLAKVYLVRLMSEENIKKLEKGEAINPLIVNALPVDEKALVDTKTALSSEETTLQYVGRKAIGRMGCYACHDIPGFDTAKPIGVALNDWGKKDPERLAFENINNYMPHHFYKVPSLTDKDGKPQPYKVENGVKKMPYEAFYYDGLVKNKNRQGYLNQKILDPRSYDYKRERTWDDRARMPEFRFARSRKREGEDDSQYEARQVVEEAEAREAVATFVLGLVAEPVPIKSINQPTGDRLAEVKGRHVLDKYNCAGCHQIRPGVFDFKMDKSVRDILTQTLDTNKSNTWGTDHFFANHKNWVGKNPTSPNRITVQGVNPAFVVAKVDPDDENSKEDKYLKVMLSQALAVPGPLGYQSIRVNTRPLKLPTSSLQYPSPEVANDPGKLKAFLRDQGPQGAAFTELLEEFLRRRDEGKSNPTYKWFADGGYSNEARSAGPPLLIGQGERTQEAWLYNFLLNPYQIRPMTAIAWNTNDRPVLRMPKFNMSPDEARALVQYFSAVERLTNPGTDLPAVDQMFAEQGLKSPYFLDKNRDYVARLNADKRVFDEKTKTLEHDKDGKPLLELREEKLLDLWKSLEKAHAKDPRFSVAEQKKTWLDEQAYPVDGFTQIILSKQAVCIGCHQIGRVSEGLKGSPGPALDQLSQRLRPGWLQRWLSNPPRMVYYTPMTPNFPATGNTFTGMATVFGPDGSIDLPRNARAQIDAARDIIIMYPHVESLPVIERWLKLPGEKK